MTLRNCLLPEPGLQSHPIGHVVTMVNLGSYASEIVNWSMKNALI